MRGIGDRAGRVAQTSDRQRPPHPLKGVRRHLLTASVSLLALAVAMSDAAAQKTMRGTELLANGVFRGANMPTVAATNVGFKMTIEQVEKRALIDWKTFNIHANDEVYFKQGGVDWIALNRIFDQNPTEIAGRITAEGQVWLMNTNGIVFKGTSRINVNTLIATQRPITQLDQYTAAELMARNEVTGDYQVELLEGGLVQGAGDGAAFGGYLKPNVSARYGLLTMRGMAPDPDYSFADFDSFWNREVAGRERHKIAELMAYYVIRKAALRELGADTTDNDLFAETFSSVDISLDPRLEAFVPIAYLDGLAADFDASVLSDNQLVFWTPEGSFADWRPYQGQDPVRGITNLTDLGIIPETELQRLSTEITDFAQFRFSQAGRQQIESERADYLANARVVVEAGAEIRTGRTVKGGDLGKAILVGTNVENHGRVEGDQVMLLAGERVFFEASQSQSLRGLTATVSADAPGAVNDGFDRFYRGEADPSQRFEVRAPSYRLDRAEIVGMEVVNTGDLFASRGNVSVIARTIDNSGTVAASTGVSGENGSVLLRASHGYATGLDGADFNLFGGDVTVSAGGQVRVDADDSGRTQLEGDVFRHGSVTVHGRRIELEGGARIVAPGAEVEIVADATGRGTQFDNYVEANARINDTSGLLERGDDGPAPLVALRDGAVIDVSGLTDVTFDMDYNVVELELRANELADSPLYRDSFVIGQLVRVDRRRGTLFADWTGALNFSEVTADQLMTAGGSVLVQAGGGGGYLDVRTTEGSVILEDGARIDVSGGSRFFRTGTIDLTAFLTPDGRTVDIGSAHPLARYVDFAETPMRQVEQGYTQGDDAGSLEVKAPRALLLAELDGSVIVGEHQRGADLGMMRPLAPVGAVNTPPEFRLPEWGALTVGTFSNQEGRLSFDYVYVLGDGDAGTVVTQVDRDGRELERALTLDEAGVAQIATDELYSLSTAIVSARFLSGMGDTSLLTRRAIGGIHLLDGVSITTSPGGSFRAASDAVTAGVTVGDGVTVTAKGGRIDFGDFARFGAGLRLDVSGEWVNEAHDGRQDRRVFIDGGSVVFRQQDYAFDGDVTVDLSGGGWYRQRAAGGGATTAAYVLEQGDGGSILFQLPDFRQSVFEQFTIHTGALGTVGSFTALLPGDVVIGGERPADPPGDTPGDSPDWYLSPGFFDRSRFAAYALQAAGDVTLTAGTVLAPRARMLVLNGTPADIPTGARLTDHATVADAPDMIARLDDAGISVVYPQDPFTLDLTGRAVTIQAGAAIDAGTLGTINLFGDYVDVHGALIARAGSVSLDSALNVADGAPLPYTWVHSGAHIDVDGIAQLRRVRSPSRGSVRVGRVLDGGTISVDGRTVVVGDGARFEASGTAATLDLPSIVRGGVVLRGAVDVASDGGAIAINGLLGQVLGRYTANAGGAGARGGRFAISGGIDPQVPPDALSVDGYLDDVMFSYTDLLSFIAEFIAADGTDTGAFFVEFIAVMDLFGFDVPTDLTPDDFVQLDIDFRDPDQVRPFIEAAFRQADPAYGAVVLDTTLADVPDGATVDAFQPASYNPFEIVAPEAYAGQEAKFIATIETFINVLASPDFGGFPTLPQDIRAASGGAIAFDPDRLAGSGIADLTLADGTRVRLAGDVDLAVDTTITVGAPVIDLNGHHMTLQTAYLRFAESANDGDVARATGDGRFTARADLIEFATLLEFDGASDASFEALEIRGIRSDAFLSGAPVGVDMLGSLTLKAGQIYPSTAQTLTFRSDQAITVLPGAQRRPTPLSAGGTLELTAPTVEQGGYLSAPLGEIAITAEASVRFLDGSITSTAAGGLEVLFGRTRDGVAWDDPRQAGLGFNDPDRLLDTSPEKRVTITGDDIAIAAGAVVDTSGGGDIRSVEFTPGIGGRTDYLDNDDGTVYAIVPAYGDVFAPFDATYDNSGLLDLPDGAGRRIHLSGGFGLPAGDYTLLPAAYALLDGAYRVRLLPDTPHVSPAASQGDDGAFVTTGRLVTRGTALASQTGFAVEVSPGDTVRLYSDYVEASGNGFFTSKDYLDNAARLGVEVNPAPRRAADGGFLTLAADSSLDLGGTLASGGVEGARGGIVDIVSDDIAIVSQGAATDDLDGFLIIDVADVNTLGAESVLFGGVRRQSERGLEVRVGADPADRTPVDNPTRDDAVAADRVIVRTSEDDPLTAPELLFVAIDAVTVEDGSVVLATGGGVGDGAPVILTPTVPQGMRQQGAEVVPDPSRPAQNYSAFLRLSSIQHADVIRDDAVANEFGNLLIGDGVVLGGGDGPARSLVLNATGNLEVGAGTALSAEVIAAATSFIAAGDLPADLSAVPGYGDGSGVLRLTPETLAFLGQSGVLDLQAFQSVDVFGDARIALAGDDTRITLTTPMIRGATADARALIGAGGVTLRSIDTLSDMRRAELAAGAVGAAGSALTIAANTLTFGDTAVRDDQRYGLELLGFDRLDATATGAVIFTGLGGVRIGGGASLATGAVVTERATQYELTAGGALAFTSVDGGSAVDPGVGGVLRLAGDTVRLDTLFELPSGVLIARASGGDLTLGAGGRILANGAGARFFELTESLPGGEVRLIADAGDVRLADGSLIDLSGGADGGEGGRLTLSAGAGTALVDGTLAGAGGQGADGASITVDVARLDGFGELAARLNQAGFTGDRSFALGAADVTVDGQTQARSFRLVTSAGDVTVDGSAVIATTGDDGDIAIFSAGDLTVAAGARLDASGKGPDGQAGDITLGIGDDPANRMALAAGATLDVSGSAGGAAGQIRLRAPRVGADVAITTADAAYVGAPAVVEAYAVVDLATVDGVAEIDAADLTGGQVRAALDAAAAYMAGAPAIAGRLGGDVAVMPGIELRASGDILLSADWNLKDERYGGMPGALALRAAGDITLDGNLSDGFVDAVRTSDTVSSEAAAVSKLTNDLSWSYTIAAGADHGAPDPATTVAPGLLGVDDGTLTINGLVRTGTGDITLAAGRDIVLGTEQAGVYTIGVESAEVDGYQRNNVLLNFFEQPVFYYHQLFPQNGGDVRIAAGGDIVGHASTSLYDLREWLWFRGMIDDRSIQQGNFPVLVPDSLLPDAPFRFDETLGQYWQTAVWVMPDRFNGGVATMGGGDIAVTAGGGVDNLTLATARTLRVAGGTLESPQKTAHFTGGGDIAVTATGDVRGGGAYVSRGTGRIRSGGEIGRSDRTGGAPVLSVGDATIAVQATTGAWIDSLFTPFIANAGRQTPNNTDSSGMIEYTRRSAVSIFSSGGDARLIARVSLADYRGYFGSAQGRLYPGQISLVAPNGGAELGGTTVGPMIMDAHENTALTVLARDDVSFGSADGLTTITTGDREYDLTPRLFNPIANPTFADRYGPEAGYPGSGAVGPDGPYDDTDARNRIYSTEGSLIAAGGFQFSNETWFKAAGDFLSGAVFAPTTRLQNNHDNDLTLIHVGGDIRGLALPASFALDGPGRFELHAGGDIFTETVVARQFQQRVDSFFLDTVPLDRLDDADLSVMSGLNRRPGYEDFADRYINPALVGRAGTPDYLVRQTDAGDVPYWSDLLIAWAERRSGRTGLSVDDAYSIYEASEPEYRTALILDVLQAELRLAGREAVGGSPDSDPARVRFEDPRRGYIAINTLFPGAGRPSQQRFDQLDAEARNLLLDAGLGPITEELLAAGESLWTGQVVSNSVLIRTAGEAGGGDIEVLSPGDTLRLALPSVTDTSSDDAGLITEDGGDIFTLSYADLITGQSRIITANTGNVLSWSSYGGIDAGSGAKTTLSIPPAVYETDALGITTIDLDNPIDGAGIATLFDLNGEPGGDIDLYAFNGTVNAGDAGIRASRDIFVGALEIRGLDNIVVGGEQFGLPDIDTGEIGPLNLEDFAEAAAERALDEALDELEETEQARARGRITSELLGLDGCDEETGAGC